MILFIRKIPANSKVSDLADFVTPALKGGLFRKSGTIIKIEILVLRDIRFNAYEFHGLVTVEPDAVALRAIKILKSQRFKDKLVIVRPYMQRSWHNDRRQDHNRRNIGSEKRLSDRRRGKDLEVVKDISQQFSSNGNFARKS